MRAKPGKLILEGRPEAAARGFVRTAGGDRPSVAVEEPALLALTALTAVYTLLLVGETLKAARAVLASLGGM